MFPLKGLNFILKDFTRTCSSRFHIRILVKTDLAFFMQLMYRKILT